MGHVKLGAILAEGDIFDPSKMIRGSPLQTSKNKNKRNGYLH